MSSLKEKEESLCRNMPCPVGTYLSRATPEFLSRQSRMVLNAPMPDENETPAFRNSFFPELVDHIPGMPECKTLHELFEVVRSQSPQYKCLGSRDMKGSKAGHYLWSTYDEVANLRDDIGAGLKDLEEDLTRGSCVGIYSLNRFEWIVTDMACHCHSLVSVPFYDTLGTQQAEFITAHAETKVVVCAKEKIDTMLDIARKEDSCLKSIVSMDEDISEGIFNEAERIGVTLTTFKALAARGNAARTNHATAHAVIHTLPKGDDPFSIMYTSGSTGLPKGVVLTHANMIAMIGATHVSDILEQSMAPMVHLSYLPLAHVYERYNCYAVFSARGRVGFFQGNVKNLLDDIAALRPTHIVGVPRVWERIRGRLQSKMDEAGILQRTLFQWGLASKKTAFRQSRQTPFWNWLVFSTVKARFGGFARFVVSAGAAMDPSLSEFVATAFDTPIMQAYGMTECGGMATISYCADPTSSVGPPLPCAEIKLRSVPDMGYFASDRPCPRGEVMIRGPAVFKEYHKDPQQTSEVKQADGWLSTGDIGQFEQNGTLTIIDRKKSILKLSQGEYVACEFLEAVYCQSKMVQQLYVAGLPTSSFLVAIVVPEPLVVLPTAKEMLGPSTDMQTACNSGAIKQLILEDIQVVGKEASVKGFETIKNIYLEPEPFSVGKGLMTPTFKLRRPNVQMYYAAKVKQLTEDIGM